MKKFILIPDSFKGTMSSVEICGILERSIRRFYPEVEVISIPVADGGEGTVDSFLAAVGGRKIDVTVKGPYMEELQSFYGLIESGKTAVIEMAAAAGLPLVGANRQAQKTTTYGVGQLMAHALLSGCKKVIVGLGGSATNDLGAGAAAAMGIRFLDKKGREFIPVGETLANSKKIDMNGLLPEARQAEIVTMCDIDNPLYGKTGAAHVFAPQKGADAEMVKFLDGQLRKGASVIKRELGVDISRLPGAGAAGGMGGGMVAFFGSTLQMGIETVLNVVRFDDKLPGTDFVFTGEGRIDSQSLRGKVVIGVARRCNPAGVPVIALVGDIGDGVENAYDEGVTAIFSINRAAIPMKEARLRAKQDLALTMENLMRFIQRLER